MRLFIQLSTFVVVLFTAITVNALWNKDPVQVTTQEVVTQEVVVRPQEVVVQNVVVEERKFTIETQEVVVDLKEFEASMKRLNGRIDLMMDIISSQMQEKG
jgi:hypothetical protein